MSFSTGSRLFNRETIDINLRDVTTSQALDYIFLQEGLFFQKLSRRTILVADQTRRPQYQQLVLRTFYLANSDPEKVKESGRARQYRLQLAVRKQSWLPTKTRTV